MLFRSEYELIILDVMLPGLNGWQLLQQIRKLGETPVLLLTTRDGIEDRLRGLELHEDDYLLKPFSLDDFRKAAQRVKRRYDMEMAADLPLPPADAPTEEKPLHDDDTIFLKTEHRVVRVNIADIRYVEGMSEYLKVHLENERPIIMLLSMKKMEERLPSSFVRIKG